jgi:fumarate hydratase subunit beta
MEQYKRIRLPLAHDQARELKVGELVLVDGEAVVTVGLPTHQRMVQYLAEGKPLPVEFADGSLFHLGACFEEQDGKLRPLYVNPSTSTRFNAQMPTLIRQLRLSAVAGKGGLSADCVAAMQEVGCVYLSMVGGASSMLSAGVSGVIESAWDDLIMQFRLSRISLAGFGPMTVAIDAHGNSVYQSLADSARARLPGILERLARR